MTPDSNDETCGPAAKDARHLSDEQSLAAAINEQVSLCAHDPAWARAFELERDRLQALLPGVFVAIEHIGSTAVPGLAAKPVVDIMAAVASLEHADALIDCLCDNGYTTSAEFNASLTDRKWLMRWRDGHRTHHLHIVVADSAQWHDRLAFRDALRNESALARRYAEFKAELAVRHRRDRAAYTDAKSAFFHAAALARRRG